MIDDDLFPPLPSSPEDACPKCGGELYCGYRLAGGGIGTYRSCLKEDCDFFEKTQDPSALEPETSP